MVGLPPESMDVPIFDTVLNGTKVVGSIVGTRKVLLFWLTLVLVTTVQVYN